MDTDELVALYETREALEGMAARLATERLAAPALDELNALLDQHAARIEADGGVAYYQEEGDLDFHYRICRGSGNPLLEDLLLGELYQLMRMVRYRFSTEPQRPQQALAEHRQIVTAMQNKDAELAEMLMRRHVSGARQRLLQRLQQD